MKLKMPVHGHRFRDARADEIERLEPPLQSVKSAFGA